MHFFPSGFFRSTSRKIQPGNSLGPVEKDLNDLCKQRPCSNITGNLQGFSISLRRPEFPLLEPREWIDERVVDGSRFELKQIPVENQIRECSFAQQDCSASRRTIGDPPAALPNASELPWSAYPGVSTRITQSRSDFNRSCGDQKASSPSSIQELLQYSCRSFPGSPSVTTDQKRLTPNSRQCQAGGETRLGSTWTLRVGEEVSDRVNGAPSLSSLLPPLVERSRAVHFFPEEVDDSETVPTRSSSRSGSGSQKEELNTRNTENVEPLSHGTTVAIDLENVIKCRADYTAGEGDGFAFFSEVSGSQVPYCKGNESPGESGILNDPKLHLSETQSAILVGRPKSTGVEPRSKFLEELSSGIACDALGGTELRRRSSGSDQSHQVRIQIIRSLEGPLTSRLYSENLEGSRGGNRAISPRENQYAVVRREPILSIPDRIEDSSESTLTVGEIVEIPENLSLGERGKADIYLAEEEGTGGSAESFTIRERIGGSPSEGNKIPERIGAGSERDSDKGKEEKLHSRLEEGKQQLGPSEASAVEERRLRPRLEGSSSGASSLGGGTTAAADESTEGPKMVRPARPSGGKDRHSKVNTAKGPRDRRVRLSVPTAVQFYDVQDRLGFDQPSKAVEWLIHKAKDAIDELGRLPTESTKEGSRAQMQGVSGTSLDMSHHVPTAPSSYINAAVSAGIVCGSSSCVGAMTSLQGPSGTNPYTDQLSLFMDSPSVTQGMFASLQGSFTGPNFGLGRMDASIEGGSRSMGSGESMGSTLARMDSRVKARERARERAKKGTGKDGTGEGSPSSSQSPPFPTSFSSFNASMEGSAHVLPFQSSNQNPFLSSVYEGNPFAGIMPAGSHQSGPFQNLNLDSQFCSDQNQSTVPNAFAVQPQAPSRIPSHTISSLQPPHLQQAMQEALSQLGSTFNPGASSPSFAEAISSHYPSVSSLPLSQLSVLGGMSPGVSSLGTHYNPTGNPTPIPPGFSPGPPASAFRAHSLSVSHCSNQSQQQQQQQLQEDSRVQQRPVLSFSAAPEISTSPAGSSSSRSSTQPFYLGSPLNTLMDSLQSDRLNRSSVGYDPGLQRTRSMGQLRPRHIIHPTLDQLAIAIASEHASGSGVGLHESLIISKHKGRILSMRRFIFFP
ncbi:hypothetical protein R1flu_021569 [Riccia fluitans]|uniref:Uncharacterized protein n=1 Tax=Riccia fluitans TaxID=41844 RepID=A0ABD1ZRH7_9MARC